MDSFFIMAFFIFLIIWVVGLIKPNIGLFWSKDPKRLKVFALYPCLMVACLIGFDVTNNYESPQPAQAAKETSEATEKIPEKIPEKKEQKEPEKWRKMDKSKQAQNDRLKLIELLKNRNVIYKIEKRSGFIYVYIDQGWYGIPHDKKQDLMNVALTYYYAKDHECDFAVIKDAYSNKEIGTFDNMGLRSY